MIPTPTPLPQGEGKPSSPSLPTPVRVVIIGGGFSGVMVATQLLRLAQNPLAITLIEPRPLLGRGLAYRTVHENHLLNVPAGRMSVFPDDPGHFLHWLNQRGNDHAGSFVPRKLYGVYVQAVLDTAINEAPDHTRIEWIPSEAVALLPQEGSAVVRLGNGQTVQADRIVLAPGHFPSGDPAIADGSFYQSRRYIRQVWGPDTLNHLTPTDAVLLIGSGLTMVDVVLALHAQGHQGVIHVISRHGLPPQSHQSSTPYPSFLKVPEKPTPLRTLLRCVRQEIVAATLLGRDWRAVMDALRPQTQALWQALPLKEQQRFLRHLRPYWDTHRHRAAPEVAAVIDQLRQSQHLQIHAGRIAAYQEHADSVCVSYQPRRGNDLARVEVSRVINCTGPNSDYRQIDHPLIRDLLALGRVRPSPLNLGLDTDTEGRLLNAQGKTSSILYTLGPPRQGGLWETMAVPEIRVQAQSLAQSLLSR